MALKIMLMEQITALFEAEVTDYFTGGAAGADCWTALMVLELRGRYPVLKIHCILPLEGGKQTSGAVQSRSSISPF